MLDGTAHSLVNLRSLEIAPAYQGILRVSQMPIKHSSGSKRFTTEVVWCG